MEISKIRRYRKRRSLTDALLSKNPVLVLGLDLPFLIATSISLRAAAAMSLELCLIHMGTMAAALFTRKYCNNFVRPIVNVAVSTLIMVFARLLLIRYFRAVTDALGMYVYLMAINGMTFVQAGALHRRNTKPVPVLAGALMNVLGFTVTMFIVSALREYIGNGTLWGIPVPVPLKLSGVLVPFFGFILMGFLLAGVRFFNKKLLALSLRERARREARFSVARSH